VTKVIEDRDRGYKAFLRRFRQMSTGPGVRVGVQGSEGREDRGVGETNVGLMLVHEFGSRDGKIPQRSVLRSTADRELAVFQKLLENAAKRSAINGDIGRELGKVGEFAVSKMRETIDRSIGIKPIKPATIKAKAGIGSTTPLIDFGILKNSITWRLE
jgi:hypothetical protein